MKIGIVGWGEIGQLHAAKSQAAGAEWVGVVSSRKGLSIAVPVYQTLAEMLPHVDAVTIAVPNHLHTQLCIQAIDAGKAVMLEKPACINSQDLDALALYCKQLKAPVHIGYRLRFNQKIRKIRENISRPLRIECSYRMGIDQLALGKDWTRSFELTGGSFFTLGIHMLDLCRWLSFAGSEPMQNICATASHSDDSSDYPLNVSISGELKDGSKLVANIDLREICSPGIEILIDQLAGEGPVKSLSQRIGASDEDAEYTDMFSNFVAAASSGIIEPDYLEEVIVTHRELLLARTLTE